MSWKSFKGKLGYHTSFNHHCGQPVLSGSSVFSGENILNLKVIPFGRNSQKKLFRFVEISSKNVTRSETLKIRPHDDLFQVSAF